MDNDQQKQILALHEQGLSFGDIARQTGIPKSTVYRIITDQDSENANSPKMNKEAKYTETVMLRKLEMEHEREMYKLKQQDRKLDLLKQRLELQQNRDKRQQKERQAQLEGIKNNLSGKYLKFLQSIFQHQKEETEFDNKEFKKIIRDAKELAQELESNVSYIGKGEIPSAGQLGYWIKVLEEIRSDIKAQNDEAFEEFQEDSSDDEFEEIPFVVKLNRVQLERLQAELKRLGTSQTSL